MEKAGKYMSVGDAVGKGSALEEGRRTLKRIAGAGVLTPARSRAEPWSPTASGMKRRRRAAKKFLGGEAGCARPDRGD
jgi:hypothetical protein